MQGKVGEKSRLLRFLKSATVTSLSNKIPKQQVRVPLTGTEWEGRRCYINWWTRWWT